MLRIQSMRVRGRRDGKEKERFTTHSLRGVQNSQLFLTDVILAKTGSIIIFIAANDDVLDVKSKYSFQNPCVSIYHSISLSLPFTRKQQILLAHTHTHMPACPHAHGLISRTITYSHTFVRTQISRCYFANMLLGIFFLFYSQ